MLFRSGSKLLRAGDGERGFAGMINRHFDVLRSAYARVLSSTLAYRPVVLVFGAIVVALAIPFFMFSQQELAPQEDQGVVFGYVQASANSTLDQTRLFATAVNQVYQSFPETGNTFQIIGATGGFGGMVTKPWSERRKTTQQLLMESSGKLAARPGLR